MRNVDFDFVNGTSEEPPYRISQPVRNLSIHTPFPCIHPLCLPRHQAGADVELCDAVSPIGNMQLLVFSRTFGVRTAPESYG